LYYLLLLLALLPLQPVFAQEVIQVNATMPCFMNYTAGINMWKNCGADEDFISFALLPFEWITGGYFSMILVSILILMVYIKYQKVVYGVIVGVMFLPIAFTLFPGQWWGFVGIVIAVGLASAFLFIFKRQTD